MRQMQVCNAEFSDIKNIYIIMQFFFFSLAQNIEYLIFLVHSKLIYIKLHSDFFFKSGLSVETTQNTSHLQIVVMGSSRSLSSHSGNRGLRYVAFPEASASMGVRAGTRTKARTGVMEP